MQTYSHFILTAVANRTLKDRETPQGNLALGSAATKALPGLPPLHSKLFLFGSVAPDLPLILLFFICLLIDLSKGNRLDPSNEAARAQSYVGYLFEYAFFHEWWVKLPHNLFHAPFLVLVYIALGYWAWRRGWRWGAGLFWFGVACAFHTAIDIPLHTNDGPLVFFPFDWETRFHSPVSYWDPDYYGRQFGIFEHLLLLASLIYLGVDWWRRRRATR